MLLLTFLHILPQWDEAGNNRGSATALLLRCQEENQRHPVGIGLTWMDWGVHLWVLQNPTMLFSTSDLIKPCNENVGWDFLKEFNIVLSLLKSNIMREVLYFKRRGRRLKHSPCEIFIQVVLRLFSFLPITQAKYCPGSRTVAWESCLSALWKFSWMWQIGFPQVGKIGDKGIWKYICCMTCFTYSLQPSNGGNHKPITGYFPFQNFPFIEQCPVLRKFFLSRESHPNTGNKVKRKVSAGCHSLLQGSLHNKTIQHFFRVDRGTAIWIPDNNDNK